MSAVSVADLKAHLNITFDSDDTLLESKIVAAEAWIERFTGTPFADYEGDIPAPLLEAVCQLAGHLYENREGTSTGEVPKVIPFGIYDLIRPYREWSF